MITFLVKPINQFIQNKNEKSVSRREGHAPPPFRPSVLRSLRPSVLPHEERSRSGGLSWAQMQATRTVITPHSSSSRITAHVWGDH